VASRVDHDELPDGILAAAACRGDRRAFGELVCRHREGVVRVVYRLTGDLAAAEDAAQEAFLRAWQRLHTYNPQHAFKNWLISIAIHAAQDVYRREPSTSGVDELNLETGEPGPEAQAETRERQESVRQAVLALSPAARAVLVLREYEGLSYGEIAGALGIPIGTVMSRLNYARAQLRQALAEVLEYS
jgi:RNA polymerase sigma-70 factor (ECF subfamily)